MVLPSNKAGRLFNKTTRQTEEWCISPAKKLQTSHFQLAKNHIALFLLLKKESQVVSGNFVTSSPNHATASPHNNQPNLPFISDTP